MKTLHASALLQLLKKDKIKGAAELLTLVGPDTDVCLLLQGIQAEIDKNVKNYEDNNYNNDENGMTGLMSDLFRFACVHYPEEAKGYLRSLTSEYAWHNILGRGAASKTKAAIDPKDAADDDDEDTNTIIAEAEQAVVREVIKDFVYPKIEKYFEGQNGVQFHEIDGDFFAPFDTIIRQQNRTTKEYFFIDKKTLEDEDEDAPAPKYKGTVAESFNTFCINTRHKGVGRGKKEQPDWINVSGVNDRIQTLGSISCIYARTNDAVKKIARERNQYYPKYALTCSFPVELLGISTKPKTFNGDSVQEALKVANTVALEIPLEVSNGYYQLRWNREDDSSRSAVNMRVTSIKRNKDAEVNSWSVKYHFDDWYGDDVIRKVKALFKKSKLPFKVKAPKLVIESPQTPLLEEILKFCEVKQEPAMEAVPGPAAPEVQTEVAGDVRTEADRQEVPSKT